MGFGENWMNPTEVVLEFLEDWLKWATDTKEKSPLGVKYCKMSGLCENLEIFTKNHSELTGHLCSGCLKTMFEKDGLSVIYPFGQYEYVERVEKGTQHQHPKRLAWVAKKV